VPEAFFVGLEADDVYQLFMTVRLVTLSVTGIKDFLDCRSLLFKDLGTTGYLA
jgi:hypothetical protein